MKKLLALLAMVAMINNASAITSEFTFDVLSSGPDIYVCNAGLRHINPAGSLSDRQGNGTVSTDDQGDYLQDVMEYRICQWDIWTSGNVSAKTLWSGLNLGGNAPDKCVTRYFFKEGNKKRRPNGKHGVRVKVKTSITYYVQSPI